MTKINGTPRNIMEWHWFVKWESGKTWHLLASTFFSRTHDFVTSMGHDLKAVKDPKSNLTFLVPGPDLRSHAVTMQSPCECFDFQCSEPTSVVAQWNATRDVNKVFKCQIWSKGSRCSRVTWVRSSEYLTYLTVFDIFKCVYQTVYQTVWQCFVACKGVIVALMGICTVGFLSYRKDKEVWWNCQKVAEYVREGMKWDASL